MRSDSNWRCGHGLRLLHLSVAAGCLAAAGLAHGAPPAPLSDEALEARFWTCDVRSTQAMLPPGDGAQCVRWQDELKRRRFDGDFERLLVWWRAHKAEQHARHLLALTHDAAPH